MFLQVFLQVLFQVFLQVFFTGVFYRRFLQWFLQPIGRLQNRKKHLRKKPFHLYPGKFLFYHRYKGYTEVRPKPRLTQVRPIPYMATTWHNYFPYFFGNFYKKWFTTSMSTLLGFKMLPIFIFRKYFSGYIILQYAKTALLLEHFSTQTLISALGGQSP